MLTGLQVVVADEDNHCVLVFSQDGTLEHKWGSRGSRKAKFRSPWHVVMRGNRVVVSDSDNHRVQVLLLDGTFVCAWGSEGSGPRQFSFPGGLAVTRTGRVLVCDRYNSRVQVFE